MPEDVPHSMNLQLRSIFQIFFTAGLGASIGQILVLRELLVLFCGNEISAGLILSSWLVWTAVGCGAAGLLCRYRQPRLKNLRAGFLFLAPVFPITLVLIRAARVIFSIPLGELIAPAMMFLIALFTDRPSVFPFRGTLCTGLEYVRASIGTSTGEGIYFYLPSRSSRVCSRRNSFLFRVHAGLFLFSDKPHIERSIRFLRMSTFDIGQSSR